MADAELALGAWIRWHWLRYMYLTTMALGDVLGLAEVRFLGPRPTPLGLWVGLAVLAIALATGQALLYRRLWPRGGDHLQ